MASARRLVSLVRIGLCVAIVLTAAPGAARADSYIEAVVGANIGCNPLGPYGGPGQCLNDEDPFNFQLFTDGSLLTVTSATDGIADSAFTYSATALTSFSEIKVKVDGSFDLASPDTRFVFANGQVTDDLTVNSASMNGQAGIMTIVFNLDGTLQSTGVGMSAVAVGAFIDTTGGSTGAFHVFTTPQNGTVTIPMTFTFGEPFHMTWFLGTFFGTPFDCGPCFDPDAPFDYHEVAGIGSGAVNYFNTMKLTGLLPTDLIGNPILDVQFTSDSGTQYAVNGVVPEPASLLLLGSGLAAYAVRRRRRASSH